MKLQEQLEKVQKDLEKGEGITNQNRIGNRKSRGKKE